MSDGQRVLVTALSETPLEGVSEHVHLAPMPRPEVHALRPHDVLIRVRSAAVSWVDLIMLSGQYQHMPTLPYSPGLEYSGVVDWVGEAVDTVAVGDRVFVACLDAGPRSSGDYQSYGGFASYAVAPASAVRPIPPGFTFDQAANFAGNYETAYHCLVTCGELQAGETVLIHGASGGTGLAAVQIAKRLGATVIATGRRQEKLDVVKSQGADHVVVTAHADGSSGVRRFRDDVKALTGGAGVDVVYDGVGGDISTESLRCVRFGARFLIVGWASTPFVARGKGGRGAPRANMLPTNLILMKGLKVLGCPMVIATGKTPELRTQRLDDLMRWVHEGALSPHISHTFPLSDVHEALRAKWRGDIIGGCALHLPEI